MYGAALFLFGLVAGSFLNALLFRMGTGRGMGGRSACASCGHPLAVLDLVPVLSWVLLRGKCRYCRSLISARYPAVELLMGALFALSVLTAEGLALVFHLAFWFFFTALALYDLKHMVVPEWFALPLAALALALVPLKHGLSIAALLSGPIVALPFLLIPFLSRGSLMGWGDWKVALALGWFLGIAGALLSLALASWFGVLLFALSRLPPLRGRGKPLTMKSEVPLVSLLFAGGILVHFTHAADYLQTILFF